jgi:alpha-galactosidase
VALSGALGIDRDVGRWAPEERAFVAAAVQLYKSKLRELITQGDLYRLQSPYEEPQAALSYVALDQSRAVVFVYRLGETAFAPVKPRGLNPAQHYKIHEVNLRENQKSRLALDNQIVTGAELMADGFTAPLRRSLESAVILIEVAD